jgi:hypothetical protein
MKAYNDFIGLADHADAVVVRDRRSPFASSVREPSDEIHNARGLIVAVMLSTACWALIGLVFLT